MSIQVMSCVWKNSSQKENKLLTLLALADNANDEGWAYPSQETLAGKVRVTKRAMQRLLDTLELEGEIIIYNRVNQQNDKQHYSNVYHLARYGNEFSSAPIELRGQLVRRQTLFTPKEGGSDSTVARGSDSTVARVATPRPPDPSYNHQLETKEFAAPKNDAASNAEKNPTASKNDAESKPVKPRRKNPAEAHFRHLASAFGHDPDMLMKTKTGSGLFWKIATDLNAMGFLAEKIPDLHRYVKNRAERENWKGFTVVALGKYAPDFVASAPSPDLVPYDQTPMYKVREALFEQERKAARDR